MAEGWPKKRRVLGTKVKRLDGPDKATGHAKYSYDINRKGMLHGIMLRCPYAHAKIKSIDTSAARKMPGFKAITVLNVSHTGVVASIDGNKLVYKVPLPKRRGKPAAKTEMEYTVHVTPGVTLVSKNKLVQLADLKPGERVTVESERDAIGRELYFAGDEVAAVAADTEEHAQDALRAIKIEYDVLDHMVNEDDVLKDPKKKTTPGGLPGNLDAGKAATKGDVDTGFKDADAVVEGPMACR